MWEGTAEEVTGVEIPTTAVEVVGVGLMCETLLEAWSWCMRAVEAVEGAVITDWPILSASATVYLWAVSEADCPVAMGIVVSITQAGAEGTSPKRGKAGLAI